MPSSSRLIEEKITRQTRRDATKAKLRTTHHHLTTIATFLSSSSSMKIIGKRKRSSDTPRSHGDGSRRQPPSPQATATEPSDVREAVSDAEVNEFFAILRRMHDASRSLVVSGSCCASGGMQAAAAAQRWRPSFAREDFCFMAKSKGDVGEVRRVALSVVEKRSEESPAPAPATRMIDLNVEPEPEKGASGSQAPSHAH